VPAKPLILGILVPCLGLFVLGCGGSGSDQKSQGQASKTTSTVGKPSSTVAGPPGGQSRGTSPTGHGKQAGGSRPGPSKQLVTQAQSKCKQRRPAIGHAQQRLDRATATLRPDTFDDAARTAGQAMAVIKAQLSDLQGLQVLGTDKGLVQKLLRSYKEQIGILGKFKSALQHRSIGGFQALQRQAYAQRISNQTLARSLGIGSCGLAP
jgi:hypothetical protein